MFVLELIDTIHAIQSALLNTETRAAASIGQLITICAIRARRTIDVASRNLPLRCGRDERNEAEDGHGEELERCHVVECLEVMQLVEFRRVAKGSLVIGCFDNEKERFRLLSERWNGLLIFLLLTGLDPLLAPAFEIWL